MAKPLVIVESPAKAKTIAGYLGSDYTVKASVGHIRDLPRSKEEVPDDKKETHGRLAGIDPDDHFDACYVVPANKKKVVAELKAALKGADELILATDEDREGEAIGWHVLEALNPRVPVRRMVFHEITPNAIREALANPRDLDMKLVEAQEGRRKLDRIVGLGDLAGAVARVRPGPGRVGGPGAERRRPHGRRARARPHAFPLRAVVRSRRNLRRRATRRSARRSSSSTPSASPKAAISTPRPARSPRRARQRRRAARRGTGAGVWPTACATSRIASRAPNPIRSRRSPRAPFTTSTLQQESGRKLRFTAARTMAVAQRLYERGFITYMRTDSTNLSEQAVGAARTAIREQYGEEYLPAEPRTFRNKVKNAQEAHEAIRPAGDRIRTPAAVNNELDGDERRLYELIWIRTVACQMSDARGRKMTIRLGATSAQGEQAVFRASGKAYDFLGWRRAYIEDVDEGDEVESEARPPAVVEGAAVTLYGARIGRARDEAARALHRGEPREGARGARHRSPFDVRRGHRDDPGALVRVAQGDRARSRRGPRSRSPTCSSGTSATSSTTRSPPRWKRRSTSSPGARVKPRNGSTPSITATARPACTSSSTTSTWR